jgi:hypothetical protein
VNTRIEYLLNKLDDVTDTEKFKLQQVRDIVPVKDWITSTYYLGHEQKSLYPVWRDTVVEFFETDKNVLIMTGSLGTGKTYCGIYIFARLLYELSCFNFPAMRFGLSPSSNIVMMYCSPTRDSAELTGFGKMRKIIDQSPYFEETFKRNKNRTSSLDFQDKVSIFSGSDKGHFLGSDLFGIIFDEANFVRAGGGEIGKMEKAIDIYRESTNRRKNRFIYKQKEYGASIIASSVDTITSFTEQEIENNKDNPNALIKHVTKYDLAPENFSSKKFWVFIGEKNNDAFVINDDNKDKYKNLLNYLNVEESDKYLNYSDKDLHNIMIPDIYKNLFVDPPENFYKEFQLDVINSLKEVAGVSVQKHAKFFSENSKFDACINNELEHPFYKDFIILSTKDEVNEAIEAFKVGDDEEIINKKLDRGEKPDYGIKGKDDISYYGRIDLSKSGDSTGFCLSHWDKRLNKCIIDIMVRFDPPGYPEKINYDKIIGFVMFLKEKRNFRIKNITMDQYQSEYFIQYFAKKRIETSLLSVDRTDEQYKFLRDKIILGEIEFYRYDRFRFELFNLIHDLTRKKVDHPPVKGKMPNEGGHGKDVTDAICGVVYQTFLYESFKGALIKSVLQEMVEEKRKDIDNSFKSVIKSEQGLLGLSRNKDFIKEAMRMKKNF